jgi:predicted acetyltransferase
MARIVDVPGALTARGYNPSITAELELTVRDPLASWNTGRWSVAVADGSATVTKRSDTSPSGADELVVDIQSLSGLYTGYVSPAELIRAGRLDSASPQAVAALAAVFAGPAPRMVDFF